MHWKMQRLLQRGGIHFKDDPENPGGGGGQSRTEDEVKGSDGESQSTDGSNSEGGEDSKSGGEGEKLTDTERKLLAESMSRKEKINSLKGENSQLQEELTAQRDQLAKILGVIGEDADLDQLKGLLDQQKEAETKAMEDRGEYERILEQVRGQNETERADLQRQIDALNVENVKLTSTIEELTVGRSFSESEFIRTRSTLPPSIARKEFAGHFERKSGVLVAYDKPTGADNRTPLVDGEGNYKPFDEAIEYLYQSHPDAKSLLKAAAKPGASSKTDDVPASGINNGGVSDGKPHTGLSRIEAGLAAQSKR